jgi:hypothetical protein
MYSQSEGINVKKKTISQMTGSRGYMPPPSRATSNVKKGKGSYKRQEGKRVDY